MQMDKRDGFLFLVADAMVVSLIDRFAVIGEASSEVNSGIVIDIRCHGFLEIL